MMLGRHCITGGTRSSVGRPRGEVADAIIALLELTGPLTAREIAHQLQVTINVAKFTCSRLHARGEIDVAGTVRVVGANRPVSRYARAAKVPLQPATAQPHFVFAGHSQ